MKPINEMQLWLIRNAIGKHLNCYGNELLKECRKEHLVFGRALYAVTVARKYKLKKTETAGTIGVGRCIMYHYTEKINLLIETKDKKYFPIINDIFIKFEV
jgi:hypothetical protein